MLAPNQHTCIPLNLAVDEYTESGNCQVVQSFLSVPDQRTKTHSLQKLNLKQVTIALIN